MGRNKRNLQRMLLSNRTKRTDKDNNCSEILVFPFRKKKAKENLSTKSGIKYSVLLGQRSLEVHGQLILSTSRNRASFSF